MGAMSDAKKSFAKGGATIPDKKKPPKKPGKPRLGPPLKQYKPRVPPTALV